MKVVILILFFAVQLFSIVVAQSDKITQIEAQIKQALAEQDYDKAAELKDEKNIYIQIDEALKNQDYDKAAELKESLTTEKPTGPPSKIQVVDGALLPYMELCKCWKIATQIKDKEISTTEGERLVGDSCEHLKNYSADELIKEFLNCDALSDNTKKIEPDNSKNEVNYNLSSDVTNAKIEINEKNEDPDVQQTINLDSLIKELIAKYGGIPDSIKTLTRGRVLDISPNGQFYLISTIDMSHLTRRTGVYLLIETRNNTIINYYLPKTEEFSSMAFIDNSLIFAFEHTTGEPKKYSIYNRDPLGNINSASNNNTSEITSRGQLPDTEKEKKKNKKKKKSEAISIATFRSPKFALFEIIVSANNNYVATHTYSNVIHAFNTVDKNENVITLGGSLKLVKITECNDEHFYCFVENRDSNQNELYKVKYSDGTKSKILELAELDDPRSCDVYDSGRYLLFGDQKAVTLIDIQKQTILFKKQTIQFNISYVEISNNGRFIAYSEAAKEARIFNTQKNYSEIEKDKEIVPHVPELIAQKCFFNPESSKFYFLVNGYTHYKLLPSITLPLD